MLSLHVNPLFFLFYFLFFLKIYQNMNQKLDSNTFYHVVCMHSIFSKIRFKIIAKHCIRFNLIYNSTQSKVLIMAIYKLTFLNRVPHFTCIWLWLLFCPYKIPFQTGKLAAYVQIFMNHCILIVCFSLSLSHIYIYISNAHCFENLEIIQNTIVFLFLRRDFTRMFLFPYLFPLLSPSLWFIIFLLKHI